MQESKNLDDEERKIHPGTVRNTEDPRRIPLIYSCVGDVFMTGIMSDCAMNSIGDNVATPSDPSLVLAWRES